MHHKKLVAGIALALLLGWVGSLAAQTTPIGFRISAASITEKDTFIVALNADSLLTGRSVFSYRLYLNYSPSYFEFLSMNGTGAVLTDWGAPSLNSSNAGTLIMAGAGSSALEGSGEMVYLKFRSLRSGSAYISFNTSECYLNEGNPSSTYVNGFISIAARSYPNIYPDSRNMFIGDEVKMTVSGGEAPYTYTAGNTLVAQVSNGDTVRAVGPGTTRISVTDNNGEVSTTTGIFDVRAVRLDIQEVSAWPADTFLIPVKLEIAPGTMIYSGRFDLAHTGGISGLPGDIIPGDFPVYIENNARNGSMSVSFASSSGITGNGVLCYLSFRANSSGSHWVRFENMRFNETLLAWTTKSYYYMNILSLPNLYLAPNSGTMMWGELLKINASNGTAPYKWTVSNPALATIDIQGNLTAISGGEVQVTATDDNGATKTSGVFTIADNHVSLYPSDGNLDTDTRVPIVSSSLPPGKAIFGFSASLSFDPTYLEFKGAESVSGGLIQSSGFGNTVQVAGAMSQGINSGVIGYLLFRINTNLALDASTSINLNSFTANENSLVSTLENGSIHRVEQVSYRPVAVAGLNFSLQEGSSGELDGTASFDLDGDPLTYRWKAPEGILLSDTTSPTPEFTAPYVSDNTIYNIRLIVNDGVDDSDPAEVSVTVLQVNIAPEVNAGPDLNFVEGSSVSLDGSASFDPDGDALSYSWKSLDAIVLFNTASVNPSLILPQVTVNTSYRFTLVVNDGALNSGTDTVTVTSIQVNKKPVAYAGGDFSLDENEAGELDGSLSQDGDNDPLTYLWTAPPQVTLSSLTDPKPTFTAPAVIRDSVLRFSLVVNDGGRDSDPDIVQVTIVNLDSLSMEALIDSVFMTDLDSYTIDTNNSSVLLHVPYGLDVRALNPGLQPSESASINPGSGTTHDFSMPVYYTVTAEDGITSRLWKLEVVRPEKTVERALNAGWNWVSLNIQPPDVDIGAVLAGLTLNDLDYLKSTEYSSTWYTATGWFGNLSAFPQNRMLKFRKTLAENMEVSGQEINPTISSIPLVKGWNDLAYLLRSDEPLGEAIEPSSVPAGDILLKGIGGSAVWYSGSGWTGELDSLKVLHGYKMNVQNTGNLRYNPSAESMKSGTRTKTDHAGLLREHGLSPLIFEHSATLIAEVSSQNGQDLLRAGDLIMAFHGEEIRGVSEAVFVPDLNRHIFILTYYSGEDMQDISFRIRFEKAGIEYVPDLLLPFQADGIYGEAYLPHHIMVKDLSLDVDRLEGNTLSLYPNPASDELMIWSSFPLREINIYTLTGEKIGHLMSTENSLRIPVRHFAPGIYTLEAVTGDRVIIRKIVITSH